VSEVLIEGVGELGEADGVAGELADVVDGELLARLTDRARAGGLRLVGEGGLLAQLAKTVIEAGLEGEMDGHLGYDKHDPAGRDGGDSRNGSRAKTLLPKPVRSRLRCPGIGTRASSPVWSQASAAPVGCR
jgi:hypothetical protein